MKDKLEHLTPTERWDYEEKRRRLKADRPAEVKPMADLPDPESGAWFLDSLGCLLKLALIAVVVMYGGGALLLVAVSLWAWLFG
jgi:hypothetical protein